MKIYNTPVCWYCKRELVCVKENVYEKYTFDKITGTYKGQAFDGDIEILCPNCNSDVSETFTDGVCNYQAK